MTSWAFLFFPLLVAKASILTLSCSSLRRLHSLDRLPNNYLILVAAGGSSLGSGTRREDKAPNFRFLLLIEEEALSGHVPDYIGIELTKLVAGPDLRVSRSICTVQ